MVDIPVNESTAETTVVITVNGQELCDFDFLATSDTQVSAEYRPLVGAAVPLTLNADYTVSGLNLPNGGSINLVGIATVVGDKVYIYRDTPIEREKDWQNEGDYKADLVNAEQDEIYMIMQELDRDIGRAVKVPMGTPGITIVPGPDGSVPKYDADGNLTGYVDAAELGNAENWSQRARAWAVTEEDVPVNDTVNPPGFSSYHWANKSEEFASAAAGSADAAADSADAAAGVLANAVLKTDLILPGQPWRTEGGFRWMRTITLLNGTDLNAITEAGRYNVNVPLNGPVGASTQNWFLLHERYDTLDHHYQELTRVTDLEEMVRWGRKKIGGAWTIWYPIVHRGWKTLEDYGDIPSTVGNNWQAMNKLLKSGFPVLLTGASRVTDTIAISKDVDGTNGLILQGNGNRGKLIFDGTDKGLSVNLGTLTRANTGQLVVRDLHLRVQGTSTGAALWLYVAGVDGAGGDCESTHDIRDVTIKPVDASSYWMEGIRLWNGRLGTIDNVTYEGRRAGWVANSVGFKMVGNLSQIPVENTWRNCKAYFVATGHEWSGNYEGMKLIESFSVACAIGFKATNTNENHADNMIVRDCHFSTSYVGIWAENFKNSLIVGNQMSGQNWEVGRTDYYGIFHVWNAVVNPTAQQHNTIRDNKIDASPIKAIRTLCTALWIDGLAGAHTGSSHIGPNEYMGCIVGEHLGANAKQNWFDNSSKYDGTTTPRVITTAGANLAPAAMVTI